MMKTDKKHKTTQKNKGMGKQTSQKTTVQIKRHWQHWVRKTQDEDRQKHKTTQKTKGMGKQPLEKTTGQIQSAQ